MPSDISQIGASAAVVITVFIFLRFMGEERRAREKSIKQLSDAVAKNSKASKLHATVINKQAKAIEKQIEASTKQREASHEVLVFMKKLNGKLENAAIQKVQEQTVEHQTVSHQEVAS